MKKGIFVLFGSNIGDRERNIRSAVEIMNNHGLRVVQYSDIYQTAPWGVLDQPEFLNVIVEGEFESNPEELLKMAKRAEQYIGRTKSQKWGEREIDIDILYFGSEVLNTDELIVPHPGIPERKFTLIPLCQIAPEFEHPELHMTNLELLNRCSDMSEVKRFKAFE